jgi:hypothetical protein
VTTEQEQTLKRIVELCDEAERTHPDCPGPLDIELRLRHTEHGWKLIDSEVSCWLPPLQAA